MSKKHEKIINRDISWLSFNYRVLQEAMDATVPLIERLKFLGIFSNNLDEFFRVRVATLNRMESLGKNAREIIGDHPKKVITRINEVVLEQQKQFELVYHELLAELMNNRIFIINEKQLNKKQAEFVKDHFYQKVRPALVPIMIESVSKFPYLKDKSIYLAVKLSNKSHNYSLIEVPDTLPRFVNLPKSGENDYIILLEDVIRFCLDDIFSTFHYDHYDAHIIKLTRDAELDLDSDLSKSITEKITKSLRQRKHGLPVRMVYDSSIPRDLLRFLLKKMKQNKPKTLIPGGRYHNFKDFIHFPDIGDGKYVYPQLPAVPHRLLPKGASILNILRTKDVMLHYPYHSFNNVLDLLHEAAIDPKVTSIRITLYRAAQNSNVVNALVNAIKNGKQVTAVIELQARFDEQANLYLANVLQEEGAKVIYGVPGLKVHSKLFLISRKEGGKINHYAHVGTGNFNESTSKYYTDFSLLTADKRITDEVEKVFQFFGNNFKIGTYKHLLVSPFFKRNKIIKLIQNETAIARQGKPAYIIMKLNNLVDNEVIKKLYQANQAGVKIDLIVRGICSLVPGIEGQSEHIRVISIVDRYLEHARLFIFGNDGEEKYYISSADLMMRNLDQRSEVACPIYDPAIQKELKQIVTIQLKDNTKARVIDQDQKNAYRKNRSPQRFRAQEMTYKYYLGQK